MRTTNTPEQDRLAQLTQSASTQRPAVYVNAADSARVHETAPGRYEVTYGPPALPGEHVAYTRHVSLRDARLAADGATHETAVAAARRSGYGTHGWAWAIDRGVWG